MYHKIKSFSTPSKHSLYQPNVSKFSALWRAPMKLFQDFCLYTSMHGFNQIAWQRRHIFERILWAFVTAGAIWGTVDISLGQLQRYNENPTVVTLEKDFRTFQFSLPGYTICEQNRVKPSKLQAVIQNFWNVTPGHEKYAYYAEFVYTVANSNLLDLAGFERFKEDETLDVDLFQLVVQVVPEPMVKISMSVERAQAEWTLVMTESGACFSTNSLAIADVAVFPMNDNDTKIYPITCQYAAMTCYVIYEITNNITFYMHSPYDVMDITSSSSHIIRSMYRTTTVTIMETQGGKGVQDLSPARRGCRYAHEPLKDGRKVFSTNSCRLTCRSRLAVKLCGCKPFYYFYEEGPSCTPKGMACLSSHAPQLLNNGGEKCACAQQCVDSIFKETSFEDKIWDKGPFTNRGSLRVTVLAPRTRYTREIVFHFQDLVVSFGGAAGLFLGASFISFVEIFYFFIFRVLKLCVGNLDAKDVIDQLPTKRQSVPYETRRMMELTSILERQKNYEHNRNMKSYY